MKKNILIGLAIVGAVLVAGRVLAATISHNHVSGPLAQHHQEVTITANPGEMVTLPFPRQNVPITVSVFVPRYFSDPAYGFYGPFLMTFMITDSVADGGVVLTAPSYGTKIDSGGQVYLCGGVVGAPSFYIGYNPGTCDEPSNDSGSGRDNFLVGTAQVAGQPNKIRMGIPDPSLSAEGNPLYGPITFNVSMWY